jgi:hypothetical protein
MSVRRTISAHNELEAFWLFGPVSVERLARNEWRLTGETVDGRFVLLLQGQYRGRNASDDPGVYVSLSRLRVGLLT